MIVLAMLLAICIADPPAAKVQEPRLRDELLTRMEAEQKARFAAIQAGTFSPKTPGKGDTKPTPDPAVWKKVEELDTANREWLKGVIAKHGWPGQSLVGIEGAHAAWLLVQHADQDRAFQKQCLERLKKAVKAREASATDLAYLTDRVLVGEGKKQLYGTQLMQKEGKLVPQPIEEPAHVDERRKAAGLPPLATYLEMAAKALSPSR